MKTKTQKVSPKSKGNKAQRGKAGGYVNRTRKPKLLAHSIWKVVNPVLEMIDGLTAIVLKCPDDAPRATAGAALIAVRYTLVHLMATQYVNLPAPVSVAKGLMNRKLKMKTPLAAYKQVSA